MIGVGSSYGNGWRQLWKNFLMLFAVGILGAAISGPADILRGMARKSEGASGAFLFLLSLPYSILLVAPMTYGVAFFYLKAARGDPPDIISAFEGFRNYWNVVLASLLVTVIVGIGFLFLVVPGIFFGCKLAFTPHLVVGRKMPALDAIQESWPQLLSISRPVVQVRRLSGMESLLRSYFAPFRLAASARLRAGMN